MPVAALRRTRKVCAQIDFRVKCSVVDLVTLLSRPEGKTLEFKRDLSSPEGVLKALVAFANTSGGVLLLGVEDGTKKVKGIRDVLTEEERLANLISDSISPKLVPSMEVMPWRIRGQNNRPSLLLSAGEESGPTFV